MLQYSPKITTDGLVMCLDASQNKSYPTDLPVKGGLLLWLDAADDSTFSYSSGSIVSQWRDKSGLNNHANQSVVGNQPSRSTFNNSRKSVNFVSSGVDYLLVSANSNLALPGDASIFIVYKPATQTTAYAVLIDNYHGQGGAKGFVIQRVATNSQFYYGNGNGSGFVDTSASPWTYTDNVIQLLSLNKASSTGTPYISGTAQTSRTVHANTVQDTTGLAIGTWGLGGREYNGDMCEILIFNRSLSSTEMKQVHTYLGQKWGIFNTDRCVFDLSGNGFDFVFNGANPRYNAKTFVSNFNTTSPFAVSSYGGQNLTSNILNLLYSDHTIEVAFNAKGFRSVYSYDNTLTTQDGQSIVIWTGRHSGLRVFQNTIIYEYWNTQSSTVGISVSISSYIDKIIYITATRTGDVLRLYINGVLLSGPTTVAATTSPVSYSQINIGAAYQGNPTTQGYIWAGQHEYHLLRMYGRRLSDSEVASNYQSFKARFDNNIVRFGLVMELDAGNPLSYAGSGSVWYDVSGNTNHATLYNSPTWNSNGYFSLNGTNNYIKTTNTLDLSTYSAVTVLVIFKPRSYPVSGNVKFICELSTDFNSFTTGFVWTYNDNSASQNYEVIAGVKGDAGYNMGAWNKNNYNDLNWEISTAVFNKSAASPETSLYNQGVAANVISNPIAGLTANNTNNFGNDYLFIGSRAGTSYFTDLDIVSILVYNRALSAAEILQNYNAVKGRFGL
jgi:hypothetical protein